LHAREIERYGPDNIAPGAARYKQYKDFLDWAADYDSGTVAGRNLVRHEEFLANLACPILRLNGSEPVAALVAKVRDFISKNG
jgi:hypothetical protein